MLPEDDIASPVAKQIAAAANAIAPRVMAIREDIHAHPELRFQEHRTSEICATELESLGIEVRRGVGKTGVVGVLRGEAISASGPESGAASDAPPEATTVAFRAEMDALPMDDLCGAPYASQTPGVAHLCGHDGHVAALLGTAHVLAGMRGQLPGNVKFLFEPAEEANPEGEIPGSLAMINDGALEDPSPAAVFGAHFYPDWPAGSIALRAGSSFSGNDGFAIKVKGSESHSAVPSTGIDAIVAAAHVVTALQSMTARELDIEEAVSITVGTISGGRASNLLADEVVMTGTARISNEDIRKKLPEMFERVVKGACDSLGATYELEYRLNLPAVISSAAEVDVLREAAREVLGRERVIEMRHPRLAADTIYHWFRDRPGVFFMAGTAGDDPATHYPSHHQRFNIAPETWPAVVAAEAITAFRFLEQAT